jgi:hypothetical protein
MTCNNLYKIPALYSLFILFRALLFKTFEKPIHLFWNRGDIVKQ